MCCNSSLKAKREFLKSLGKRKTFVAWKVLRVPLSGFGLHSFLWHHKWRPGVNRASSQAKRYDMENPTGFHVYLCRDGAGSHANFSVLRIVPVLCHIDDLWRVNQLQSEAVIRNKVILRRKDYKAAIEGAVIRRPQ